MRLRKIVEKFIHCHPYVLITARVGKSIARGFAHPYWKLFSLYYKMRLKKCGKNVDFSTTMIIRHPKNIIIGDKCSFSNFVILDAHSRIRIGRNCMFANNSVIATATHDEKMDPMNSMTITKDVEIGDNVWIGVGAVVLPGVTVGSGAIIGAQALVERDVPSNAIVVGIPARILKYRNIV